MKWQGVKREQAMNRNIRGDKAQVWGQATRLWTWLDWADTQSHFRGAKPVLQPCPKKVKEARQLVGLPFSASDCVQHTLGWTALGAEWGPCPFPLLPKGLFGLWAIEAATREGKVQLKECPDWRWVLSTISLLNPFPETSVQVKWVLKSC